MLTKCPMCHELNFDERPYCKCCGHETYKSRAECGCRRCLLRQQIELDEGRDSANENWARAARH